MTVKTTLAAAFMALAATTAIAHDAKIGALTIDHPYSFPTPPSGKHGAGFMTITNMGDTPDRLMGVKSSFARTMVHKTEMVDGVMKMRHQMGGVLIPVGETVSFEPGGFHIMFMELTEPFKEGDGNTATLIFKHAGEIDVEFKVEKRGTKKKTMDHSGHDTTN